MSGNGERCGAPRLASMTSTCGCADDGGPNGHDRRETVSAATQGGIEYVFRETSLGLALVAATARGVRAVLLGDDRTELEADLRRRSNGTPLQAGGPMADRFADSVVTVIESPGAEAAIPLDLAGTDFQRQVWDALMHIPPGATASYGEIAERIGAPGAVRAVAQACGANSVAVVVPCHRAVRSDGALAGYRWGVDRKRALLAKEATAQPTAAPG
jgi:AraC family transcriptional regulator of adaptative response/methylated-DNA-[protein]-cysteine methyltransferase